MLRRKQMPEALRPAWTHFVMQAERVEAARQALLGCLPVGRVDPAPVPVGLDLVRDELKAIGQELDVWRVTEIEQAWQRCRTAIEESLGAVEEARRVAEISGELEELLEAVGDVTEPLDAWADAERSWLVLRTRRSS